MSSELIYCFAAGWNVFSYNIVHPFFVGKLDNFEKVQNISYSFMSYIALFSISPITLPFDIEFDCFRREKKGGQPSDTVLREVHHGPATLDDDV